MKKKLIEIPYVKNASEMTFVVPEKYEARVEDGNKVIVKKKEPELTEFEREFKAIVEDKFGAVTPVSDTDVHKSCEKLLELAREELKDDIRNEIIAENGGEIISVEYHNLMLKAEYARAQRELCKDCPSRGITHAYLQGKADALNDLPKWKKVETNAFYPDITYSDKGKCPMLHYGEYKINIVKLKETLPKEEE